MKKILILLFFVEVTSSCTVQGWTNDYDKLTEAQKGKIARLLHFSDVSKDSIYKLNGMQLREELKNHPKSIVYLFSNGCSSEFCRPLPVYEDFAVKNGYQLFLVMNGYTDLNATIKQPVSGTLFVIDNDYYNEKLNNKYTRYFENDLTKKPLNEKAGKYSGNLYFFEGDTLVQILRELPANTKL
ncbi:MAG: hypothetical protein AB9834_02030 [Lentimicrobium sp.]